MALKGDGRPVRVWRSTKITGVYMSARGISVKVRGKVSNHIGGEDLIGHNALSLSAVGIEYLCVLPCSWYGGTVS